MSLGALPSYQAAHYLLTQAERAVALLARVQPLNAQAERQRLLSAWQAGQRSTPGFCYPPAPDMHRLHDALETMMRRADQADVVSQLYVERAAELGLEARLVEAVGRSGFRRLAKERFVTDEASHTQADTLARAWVQPGPGEPHQAKRIESDDETQPSSLISLMRKEVDARQLAVRVSLSRELSALAATGDATIYVATGRALCERTARRVVAHEVFGHCIPRVNARSERLGLFVVGSALGNDEQEGYALSVEQGSQHMDQGRRFELGLRHLVAKAMFDGADFRSSVELSLGLGAALPDALSIATRVYRGGGLGREVAYLPAFCRVTTCKDQSLLRHLSRGRLSLHALCRLRAAGRLSERL